jgi:hypothetical protein
LRKAGVGLKSTGHSGRNRSAQQNSQAQCKHGFHRLSFLKQSIAANFALKLAAIQLTRHSFQGDWNCTMSPN